MTCSNVYVNFPESGLYGYAAEIRSSWLVQDLCNHLICCQVLPPGAQSFTFFTKKGLPVKNNELVKENDSYYVHLRLKGGKGGFGSMLRAIGSQIEKTTNNEACRDLSGRRMRDVNNEKKMMEWVKKKAEKDRLKEKEKIEKLERQLQKPKHFFNDPEYKKKLDETSNSVEDALKAGLKANKRITTAPNSKSEPTVKKSKLWLGADDLTDSSDSDSESEAVIASSIKSTNDNKEKEGQCSSSSLDNSSPGKAIPVIINAVSTK